MENGGGRSGGAAAATQYTKESLKSKLDENHLDLSLSNMEIVPVQALAGLPRATSLDLSCNRLTSLGAEFSTLVHLVKLDLSKNRLTSLPPEFGALQRLQHLDLYNNSLTGLPLSFARLTGLKWLDLRDNPIDAELRSHAGECLNEAACRTCAKQVVAYMKTCQSEAERRRQKQLQEERVRESARKMEEELERQKAQLAKKAQKEARRQELIAQRAAAANQHTAGERAASSAEEEQSDTATDVATKSRSKKTSRKSGGWSCLALLFGALLFLAGLLTSLYLYCQMDIIPGAAPDSDVCVATRLHASRVWDAAQQLADIGKVWAALVVENVRTRLDDWIN